MSKNDNIFLEKLKAFLHDPIDKCLNIPAHEKRARCYAKKLGISSLEEAKGSDQIASCMERSLLPKEKIYQDFTEIRHPLSKEKLKVQISEDKNSIFKLVEEAFDKIKKEIFQYDDKKKFFYLWRNLQDEIYKAFKNKEWIKYLSVLPADTRIPDHSIWEHLKIASAINAFLDKENNSLFQNNSLFLFSIGPVQSFISQARKVQDFYMGSFILSYLTFIAMKILINKYGPTSIIYPDLFKQPLMDWFLEKELKIKIINSGSSSVDLPTIPNRFVAIIPNTKEEEIKKLVNSMKREINIEIENAKNKILEELKNFNINLNDKQKQILNNHLKNFPQIYWIAIPWKLTDGNISKDITFDDLEIFHENEEIKKWKKLWNFATSKGEYPPNIGFLYQLIYTTVEKAHAARKNLREFSNLGEEAGRKCSLCGEKNVLFFNEKTNPQKFLKYNNDAVNIKDFLLKYMADGEGLCGLCFLKRAFDIYLKSLDEKMERIFDKFSFPSKAEVAVADFKEKALQNAYSELKNYENEMLKLGFLESSSLPKIKNQLEVTLEGEWFFEENLRKEFIKKVLGIELSENEINDFKNNLKTLTEKVGKPNPYYAVIHLDGDNMGKWLSGELLPEIKFAYNSQTWENLPEDFKKELKERTLKKFLTPAIHSAISTALRNYAIEFVKKIVEEEHLGKLIYVGGDDVLAFVNLKDLLDVMEKLRWAFSGHIKIGNGNLKVDLRNNNGFVKKEGRYFLTMGPEATASMGVVIAHYKEPLKIVINKVFDMEKEAKKKGRDRFAISLIKKSGEERQAVFQWITKDDERNVLITELMKNIKKMMDEDEERYISRRFIQKFKINFIKLKDKRGYFSGYDSVVKTELKRLILRAYNSKIKKDIKEKTKFCEEFLSNVWNLFVASQDKNIDNFVNMIEILSFMNKGD